jgi:hypothetical protein
LRPLFEQFFAEVGGSYCRSKSPSAASTLPKAGAAAAYRQQPASQPDDTGKE